MRHGATMSQLGGATSTLPGAWASTPSPSARGGREARGAGPAAPSELFPGHLLRDSVCEGRWQEWNPNGEGGNAPSSGNPRIPHGRLSGPGPPPARPRPLGGWDSKPRGRFPNPSRESIKLCWDRRIVHPTDSLGLEAGRPHRGKPCQMACGGYS